MTARLDGMLVTLTANERLTRAAAARLVDADWRDLAPLASQLRDRGWSSRISYSRKVFIPLTRLCRDVCHYCTFATTPRMTLQPYLDINEALTIARAGAAAGCKEALFTLGDRPERRYRLAANALSNMGHASTIAYLGEVAERVRTETGLLPHFNPGLLSEEEFSELREVAPSMGLMLETSSHRLSQPGGPHFGSPDKRPDLRLAALQAAGRAEVPMTTGILIGIGETRLERLDALFALRDIDDQYGHIQEVIVQNFRAKPGTKMANHPEPDMADLAWTVAVSRLIFGARMSIQAPPNLHVGDAGELIEAGINDFGGISPVTPDHVNPEAPWPHIDRLETIVTARGSSLVERLTIYPRFIERRDKWIAPRLHGAVLRLSDGGGLARSGAWSPGIDAAPAASDLADLKSTGPVLRTNIVRNGVAALAAGRPIASSELAGIFDARASDFVYLCDTADNIRAAQSGDGVSFVVNRNINYTNICLHHCGFCAFSKGRTHEHLRGKPYVLPLDEIELRVREARLRGATEVCMQGGIHPTFDGNTYLDICRAAKRACPEIHVHAFSPLEITHGAQTLGISIQEFLSELKAVGLGSLPGTAAEILSDDVRTTLAPGKPNRSAWLEVARSAHRLGIPTTSTIMFGHIDTYRHWADHLILLRDLQAETGGFTEFVPLPFVHMEAPMYLKGRSRAGPTLRETIAMHAVARLTLGASFRNIQTSWVKLGPHWSAHCLRAGANDLGGTLMNESISRAAGAAHGQEMTVSALVGIAADAGRPAIQRTTLYAPVSDESSPTRREPRIGARCPDPLPA